MRTKKYFSFGILSWLSFAIILITGALEFYSPNGVFLSWGFVVSVFLTRVAGTKRDTIIAMLLSLVFILFSFFRIENDVDFKTALLTRFYSIVGLGFTGYFILRFIKREAKYENERTLMAGIFFNGTEGIMLAKSTGEIVMANPYAERMSGDFQLVSMVPVFFDKYYEFEIISELL
jgi:hypothetical protein